MSSRSGGRRALRTASAPGRPARVVPSLAIVAFALVIAGGYAFKWTWTGFTKDDQLWDMLHVLVLPVVLATLPLWYRTRERWRIEWHVVLGAVAVVFAVLVVGGYALGWSWTGFQGNTLWDWLELLALPVVVSFLPLWFETHRRLEGRWQAAFAVLLVAFAIAVVGGYRLHWGWTGFEGNTVRDWLQLLVVPFLLPASLAWFAARREVAREEQEPAALDVQPVRPAIADAADGPAPASAFDPAPPGDRVTS